CVAALQQGSNDRLADHPRSPGYQDVHGRGPPREASATGAMLSPIQAPFLRDGDDPGRRAEGARSTPCPGVSVGENRYSRKGGRPRPNPLGTRPFSSLPMTARWYGGRIPRWPALYLPGCVSWMRLPQVSESTAMLPQPCWPGGTVNSAPAALMRS